MSFDLQALERVNGGIAQANAVWVYSSSDTMAAITASGYFDEAKNLKVDDYLLIVASDESGIYNVLTLSPTAVGVNGGDTIPAQKWVINLADVSLTDDASSQSPFTSGYNSIAVEANKTYFFESVVYISSGGTTHRQQFGFGGTSTVSECKYQAVGNAVAAGAVVNQQGCYVDSTSMTNIGSNAAATDRHFSLRGSITITAAGTLTPLIAFSTAPGGTPLALESSYFRIWEAGGSSDNANGDWS